MVAAKACDTLSKMTWFVFGTMIGKAISVDGINHYGVSIGHL
jgi:hypothetical protein